MTGDQSLIGSIGVVIVATRGKAGPGEVLLKIRGGTEAYLAWSTDPIPKGASVLVTGRPYLPPTNPAYVQPHGRVIDRVVREG